ncbi:MAG TPA: hypothetical protein PK313_09250, partial [Myxococcota bacterium]|nr:hypothetical protein [Myxococcota bacterium]
MTRALTILRVAIPVALCVAAPAHAQPGEGEDMTRQDRTALLFATKFLFTADHVPIVTVLIMEGESSIRFSSTGPLSFLSEGEGGPRVTLGRGPMDCTATLEGGR